MREVILFILYILIFLCAIALLRNGLFNLTGDRLKAQLRLLTNTSVKGFFTGIIFTALLQSNSAVMIMTIGLVSVGGITFQNSIGIILGSNIGTTVTAEFLTFSTDQYIYPGLIFSFLLMLIPKPTFRYSGFALFGLFMIFFAINGFTSLAEPLAQYDLFIRTINSIENNLILGILAGTLFAATIHSGTATIAIAMGFIMGEQLSVTSGIAIMLGSNIGTCVTGYIASVGAGREAKLTAYAHIWLNVLGVILFFPFINELQSAAAFFTNEKHIQLAHASVIFNIICSLLVLPFVNIFSRFVLALHNKS